MEKYDKNNQPNPFFNQARNKDKALYSLIGLLQGITADNKLNELEITFLDTWLRDQTQLHQDADVVDILDFIGDVLSDNIITQSELSELSELINTVIDYRDDELLSEKEHTNKLLGLINGLLADNYLNNNEIQQLKKWINDNDLDETWPACEINKRIKKILEDGIITEDEREDLTEALKLLTGNTFFETGIASGMATSYFCNPSATITHQEKTFCFTGKFVNGSRNSIETRAKKQGAHISNNVTRKTDYLVIGTLASRDWAHTSHGRKIQKAIDYQSKNIPITIISERDWLNS